MQHGIPGLHRDKEEYTVCNTIHPPLMRAQELNIRCRKVIKDVVTWLIRAGMLRLLFI